MVSYDLAAWSGPRPADDAAAAREFQLRQLQAEVRQPASATLASFVADLLERYPEDDPDDSPWAAGPLIDEASGDFIHFAMTYSGAERAYEDVVRTAQRHGLVCFDPQTGQAH